MRPPVIDLDVADLPVEATERHDALVDVFGRYIAWMRRLVTESRRGLVEMPEARGQLGRLFQDTYQKIEALGPSEREAAYGFAQECVDGFAREMLRLLSNAGDDLQLGPNHYLQFRLVMEIHDKKENCIVHEEILNRGGKHFPGYWGRWLNRFMRSVE